MATTISQVNAAPGGDKFTILFNRVNQIANAISTLVLTANATGGVTSGNSFLLGIFGANVGAFSELRGGNIGSTGAILISSNVTANGELVVNGLLTANVLYQGNDSINSTLDRVSLSFENGDFLASYEGDGWMVSNGTTSFTWVLPDANSIAAGMSFQHANGSWYDPSPLLELRGTLANIAIKTDNYVLTANDKGQTLEFNKSTAVALTISNNAVGDYPNNMWVDVVQTGAGTLSFTAGPGVTLRSKANSLSLASQYSAATLYYKGGNVWQIIGDVYLE